MDGRDEIKAKKGKAPNLPFTSRLYVGVEKEERKYGIAFCTVEKNLATNLRKAAVEILCPACTGTVT